MCEHVQDDYKEALKQSLLWNSLLIPHLHSSVESTCRSREFQNELKCIQFAWNLSNKKQ